MQANLVEYAPFWIPIPRSIAEFPKRVASEDSQPRKLCQQPVPGASDRSEAIPFRQFAICIANQLPLVGNAALPLVLPTEIASPIFPSRDRKPISYRSCNFCGLGRSFIHLSVVLSPCRRRILIATNGTFISAAGH